MKKAVGFILMIAYLITFITNKTLNKTVGFDYDFTLAFSIPTFAAEKKEEPSERMDWELINGRLLDVEKKKRVAGLVPFFKCFGLTPIVITGRPEVKGDIFRAHVFQAYGVKPDDVYMTRETAAVLKKRHTVLFFGDSDGDITEAQKADVRAIRVKRSAEEGVENYRPGHFGEWVLPFSDGRL